MSDDIKKLQEERDRYKKLAQGQLAQDALEKAFEAARKAAIAVMKDLPEDELEAIEAQIDMKLGEGLTKGFRVTWAGGTEALMLEEGTKKDADS